MISSGNGFKGEQGGRTIVWGVAGGLFVATCLAYANSIGAALVMDDYATVLENPTLAHWRNLGAVLFPPANLPVGGRPVANLSFALNYALSGTDVRGFHATNIVIHACAALAFFGLVRRTLMRIGSAHALSLAAVAAAIWALHPVQTASVTYLAQRTEALMGLFYLLTIYAFVRAVEGCGRRWWALSILCCALGMGVKEVMATAPLMVLFYDRVFVSGSLHRAWLERRAYYLGLFTTWIILGGAFASGMFERGVGFGLGITPWSYALAQTRAVWRYLQLVVWPHPLVFDYGTEISGSLGAAVPFVVGTLLILAASALLLWRKPRIGFLAGAFFLLLAPSSSFVPVALQPVAENRLYLPSGVVIIFLSLAARRGLGAAFPLVACLLLPAYATSTIIRNRDYASELTLWSDTIAKRPDNPRAYDNFALALCKAGRSAAAIPYLEHALKLNAQSAPTHAMLGNAHFLAGRFVEAAAHYAEAVRLNPAWTNPRNNLGISLLRLGRPADAIPHFESVLQADPRNPDAHWNLGNALAGAGRFGAAAASFQRALQFEPRHVGALNGMGELAAAAGDFASAANHFRASLQIQPNQPGTLLRLAEMLIELRQFTDAEACCEQALRAEPNRADAVYLYGLALSRRGQREAAIARFERALQIEPHHELAGKELANARSGR